MDAGKSAPVGAEGEEMMKVAYDTSKDLRLLALLVDRQLRQNGLAGPEADHYSIVPNDLQHGGKTDVRVAVDLGRGLVVELDRRWCDDDHRDFTDLVRIAEAFAQYAEDLHANAATYRRTIAKVNAAAKAEVAKGVRKGLPYRLLEVTPARLEAYSPGDFEVAVSLEMAGRTPRPEIILFAACCAEDVKDFFAANLEEQSARATVRETLARVGATGLIDPVLVAALKREGVDMPSLLRRLRDCGEWIVDIDTDHGRGRISPYWKDGVVEAHLSIAEGVRWGEGMVTFQDAPATLTTKSKGRPLSDVVPSDLLDDSVRIRTSRDRARGFAIINCERQLLHFDAESGAIW